MEIQQRVEELRTERVEAPRVALRDVLVAEDLAHHRTVPGPGQAVVVAAARTAARELDAQLAEHLRDPVVDVRAAVVGVDAQDSGLKGKCASLCSIIGSSCASEIVCKVATTCRCVTPSTALMWCRPLMPSWSPWLMLSMRMKPGRPSGAGALRTPIGAALSRRVLVSTTRCVR